MRLRLRGGQLNKARRGELYFVPPSGYEWDSDTSRFRLDRDEQVTQAIRLVFERFRLDGSAYAVARYLIRTGLKIPVRDLTTRTLHWVDPRQGQILSMLHNPIYAGVYAYGRHEYGKGLVDGELRQRVTKLPQSSWKACIRDHHPAYISWEEFTANQTKLEGNCTRTAGKHQRSAAREGAAVLQGLAMCGRCGQRMHSGYTGNAGRFVYQCNPQRSGRYGFCWSVAGKLVDQAVIRRFFEVIQPPELELGLAVTRETQRQVAELSSQWRLRLERLEYETRLAERRYKATDPEYRVVARTLEREWNEKLGELEELRHE